MKNWLIVGIILVISSCNFLDKKPTQSSDQLKAKQSMMDADKAFSKLCEEKGMRKAFIEYIDDKGVLLRPGKMPIVGADAIDFLTQVEDKSFSLSWEPKGAMIAKSGDLGFTYGIYSMKTEPADSLQKGTYVSIWKKNDDGSWKFVLDTGNDGVDE